MSEENALDPYYREVKEFAREVITLIKFAEECGGEHGDPHAIRGQIRQQVTAWESEASSMRTWLLIEVLARSVAATYEDLDDWSGSVLTAIAAEEDER